jgi:hypothetical protein
MGHDLAIGHVPAPGGIDLVGGRVEGPPGLRIAVSPT